MYVCPAKCGLHLFAYAQMHVFYCTGLFQIFSYHVTRAAGVLT